MADVVKVIQMLVAPVVMISACGLLCLAFYNRLAVVVARIRAFNHERLDLQEKLAGGGAVVEAEAAVLKRRLEAVDVQVDEILKRARLVRNTLIGLVSCIVCMVLCSLLLGVSLWVGERMAGMVQQGALGVFVVGVLSMLGAMILALMELERSLAPVALDRDYMLRVDKVGRAEEEAVRQ